MQFVVYRDSIRTRTWTVYRRVPKGSLSVLVSSVSGFKTKRAALQVMNLLNAS
jgi:hypothetical protein